MKSADQSVCAHSPHADTILALARDAVARTNPAMKWTWGQALFGFALSELDAARGTEEFTPFLTAFCDHYVKNPPRIDYADTAAPALITYAMYKKTGNPACKALTDRALDYIRNEPRLLDDAVNHLGHSPEARWYPKSIWVDSLMMFSVFPARYARETGDEQLLDFAARQPAVYQRYLQDKRDKLWYHSYWTKAARPHPGRGVYWARGNGWVVCALPMIMASIGSGHARFAENSLILRETADAVLARQNADGSFNTILGKRSYPEMSATALVAAGLLRSVRLGFLPDRYLPAARKALDCVVSRFTRDQQGLHMTGVSAPTIPLHVFPALGYRLTPRGRDLSYGLAAVILAAVELYRMGDAAPPHANATVTKKP